MAKQTTAQLPKYRRRYFPLYPRELDKNLSGHGTHRSWFLTHVPEDGAMVRVAYPAGDTGDAVQYAGRIEPAAPPNDDRPVFTHLEFRVDYDDGKPSPFGNRVVTSGIYLRLSATTLEGGIQTIAIARTPCASALLESASRLNRKRIGELYRVVLSGYLTEAGQYFGVVTAFLARHRFEPVEEPFGYAPIPNEWRNETVVGLLRACLRQKAYDRFPILADALEEAGCADGRLLAALRRDRREDVVGHEILIRCLNTPPEDEE
jgi:hypothetical protein